jgi:hypothetical protein
MQERDFEHEGELSRTDVKRARDKREAASKKMITHCLLALTENGDFLLYFQRFVYPMMAQDFPVNNGSALAHFMGKRQLVLQIVAEMDAVSPGFLSRLLATRDSYEKQLRAAEESES